MPATDTSPVKTRSSPASVRTMRRPSASMPAATPAPVPPGCVKVTARPLAGLRPPEQKTRTIRDTVAALRLDAVASTGFSLSRSKMAALISSGKLTLNGRECDKPDRLVEEGAVLTCRGLGKCVLTEVNGASKKGRVMIVMERYL